MFEFCAKFLLSDRLGLSFSEVEERLTKGDFSCYMVLLLINSRKKIELIPTLSLRQPYYRNQPFLCFGAASTTQEAQEMLTDLYAEAAEETGGIDLVSYLKQEGT